MKLKVKLHVVFCSIHFSHKVFTEFKIQRIKVVSYFCLGKKPPFGLTLMISACYKNVNLIFSVKWDRQDFKELSI